MRRVMDFLVQVRWKNGSHPLLQRGDAGTTTVWNAPNLPNSARFATGPFIEVAGDDGVSALNQNWTENGTDFLVKDAQSKISVSIAFRPNVGGIEAETLSANQTYAVSGDTLIESTATVGPTGGPTTTVTRHPLVTGVKLEGSPAGQTTFRVTIDTSFVDATEHWKGLLGKATTCMSERLNCWKAYRDLHEPGTELVVLAFTPGRPLIWFAAVPDACKNANAVSALVFFRPTAATYATIERATRGMYALTRYLLRPRSPEPGVWWARDRYHEITDEQFASVKSSADPPAQFYDRLCAGFENALSRCGKSVILLYPLPSGTDFGAAAGPGLAGGTTPLLAQIRALLHARGKIGVGQTSVAGSKLGLAGYSAGGLGLFPCLQNNRQFVNEVYGFDPNGAGSQAGNLAQWAFDTQDFRLRLAAGFAGSVATNQNILDAVNAKLAGGRPAGWGEATTHPASPETFYLPSASGGHAWWNHVFSEWPAALTDGAWAQYRGDTRHQFVIYGGEDPAFAPASGANQPWNGTTFMGQFLATSTF
jgi:hypothetical protein